MVTILAVDLLLIPEEPGLGLLWLLLPLDSCAELDGLTGLELKRVDFWGMNFIGFIIGRIGEGFVKRTMEFIYLKVHVASTCIVLCLFFFKQVLLFLLCFSYIPYNT